MDLPNLTAVHRPATRSDLGVLGPTVAPLAGGTWLYSEPQPTLTALVDLTALGWPAWRRRRDGGLSLAATCTLRELVGVPAEGWPATALFRAGAESLLQSSKVWDTATVGGNIATALAAGALIGVTAVLDADLVVWTPDGGERRERVEHLVLGQRATTLAPGEVLRSIEIGPGPMAAATAFRRIALSTLGRAGVVVAGRRDEAGLVVVITGGTVRPEVLRFAAPPQPAALAAAVGRLPSWFTDAHGDSAWRRAMGVRLAEEIREELVG